MESATARAASRLAFQPITIVSGAPPSGPEGGKRIDGRPDAKILDDGWTAVTRDRSLSAQFEHSIGITETGCEIFTLSPAGLSNPPYAA